jgi:Gas vesicle synthesis protein GvpL/GvpF
MIYVYAIASVDASVSEITGLGGHGLQIVGSGAVRALISDHAPEIPQDGATLGALWLEQQKIVTNLQATSALPTKLGSRLSSVAALIDLLYSHQETLLEQLKTVQGKIQINLSAFWKLGEEIGRIASNSEIASLRQELASKAQITHADQARIGELIAQGIEAERQHLTDRTLSSLEGLTLEYGSVPHGNDETAFNMVVLIEAIKLGDLDSRLKNLELELNERLHFKRSLPMPAFVFSALELIEPSSHDLEQARITLRLPSDLPSEPNSVHRAFKQLALERHPDRNPHDPNAADNMRQLSWARDLLEVCGSGVGVRVQRAVA